MVPGKNVVDVGKKVDAKLNEIMSLLPLGVQVETIYAQHCGGRIDPRNFTESDSIEYSR